jgi:hypothetical protein
MPALVKVDPQLHPNYTLRLLRWGSSMGRGLLDARIATASPSNCLRNECIKCIFLLLAAKEGATLRVIKPSHLSQQAAGPGSGVGRARERPRARRAGRGWVCLSGVGARLSERSPGAAAARGGAPFARRLGSIDRHVAAWGWRALLCHPMRGALVVWAPQTDRQTDRGSCSAHQGPTKSIFWRQIHFTFLFGVALSL